MYHIIGNSPKRVELKDLNDCVYYKQQKVYSDSQYRTSVDLQRAIERKSLIVLRKSEDSTGTFEDPTAIISAPVVSTVTTAPVNETQESSSKIDLLLDKINKLEDKLRETQSPSSNLNETALAVILDRLEKLEKNPSAVDLSSIQEALKSIETRMQDNKSDGILEKLENIISKAGTVTAPVREVSSASTSRVEEVYIPNIKVEDANSHINLEVRKLDDGDSVADSLRKLKELKSKLK